MAFEFVNWALKVRASSSSEKFVLFALCNWANEDGVSYPSYRAISNFTQLSTKTVKRAVDALVKENLVHRKIRSREDGSTTSYQYLVNVHGTPPRDVTCEDDSQVEAGAAAVSPLYTKDNTILKHSNDPNLRMRVCPEFHLFWGNFPKDRAGSKLKAFQAWEKTVAEERCTPERLIEVAATYAKSAEVSRGFAKGAASWLNDDRFNSKYAQTSAAVPKREYTGREFSDVKREMGL